jgi:hypothetical protein
LQFDIAPDGRAFFSIDDQNTRQRLLEKIGTEYKIEFTPKQIQNFKLTELWGMDVNALPAFLDQDANTRANAIQPGLKIDTVGGDYQIENLILWSRQANPDLRIAIKADKTTDYKSFDKIIQALQNRKVNRFNLITSAKQGKE